MSSVSLFILLLTRYNLPSLSRSRICSLKSFEGISYLLASVYQKSSRLGVLKRNAKSKRNMSRVPSFSLRNEPYRCREHPAKEGREVLWDLFYRSAKGWRQSPLVKGSTLISVRKGGMTTRRGKHPTGYSVRRLPPARLPETVPK